MGTHLPSSKTAPAPIFGPYLLQPNGCMDQDATGHGARPQPRRLCVRWEPRSPPKKGGGAPKFSAHVYCGQTAGCIKMPLGMAVGLGPDDIVFDGTWRGDRPQPKRLCIRWGPSPPPKKAAEPPPIFGPFLLWPNSWMHQDATWYGGRPWPRRHCVRWGPSSAIPKKGAEPPPNFRPMSIVAKLLHGSRWHLAWGGPWSRPHCTRWGHSSPPRKRDRAPQFLAHVYCGRTAGWIKTPLGTEVDLGPGHFVLDGFPASGERGTVAPLFSAHTYCGHGRPSQLLLSSCNGCHCQF